MGLMLCFCAVNGGDGSVGAVLLMVGHSLLLMLCFSSLVTHSVLVSAVFDGINAAAVCC